MDIVIVMMLICLIGVLVVLYKGLANMNKEGKIVSDNLRIKKKGDKLYYKMSTTEERKEVNL